MIPQFFTVTLRGGRATTRINAHAVMRLSASGDACAIHLPGADPLHVNHSVEEVEALIAELAPATRVTVTATPATPVRQKSVKVETHTRQKAA